MESMTCFRCGGDYAAHVAALDESSGNAAEQGWTEACVKVLRQQLASLTLRVEALEEREIGEFDDLIQKSDAEQSA